MSNRTGIIVAANGKSLKDEPLAYSSENSHLLIDTSPAKEHLKIIPDFIDGHLITVNSSTGGEIERHIFKSIPHGLPRIPRVSVYFLVRQVPAALSGFENQYSSYLYYGGFPFYEAIFFRVDETYVHLIHEMGVIGETPGGNYDSIMQDILMNIKYMIYENEGLDEPYESTFNVL